jgi:hypothetical protein
MAIKTRVGTVHNKSLARQIVHWDSKGHDVSQVRNAQEMVNQAGLDWEVKLSPIVTPNGTETVWNLAVREDKDGSQIPLSVVPGKNWDALDNLSFCQRAMTVAEGFGGTVSRAGWLQKETTAVNQESFLWAMITPGYGMQDCIVEGYEGIKPLILLTSGTSYSRGYSAKMMFVRSLCQNGLVDLQATTMRSTHQTTLGAFENFTCEEVAQSIKQYARERDVLLNTQLNIDAAYAWFIRQYSKAEKLHVPIENQSEKIRTLWAIYQGEMDKSFAEAGIDLAQAQINGTYYGLLQSVVAYHNHFGRGRSDNTMMEIVSGDRAKEMDKVRQTLLEAARMRERNSGGISVGVRAFR